MESRAEPRDRSSDRELLSSTQDGVIRETVSMASPGQSSKSAEKKLLTHTSKSFIVPASHHRSSHSLDRPGHTSSSSGALDLQSLVARSSSSSSISGITVPIRLDALSYLLNNAVLGASKMPSQMPYYPPAYPACPYMGYPYGPYMSSPSCNMAYMNQFPAYQPGLMPSSTQQGVPVYQNPMPNFSQGIDGTTPSQNMSVFPGFPPQSGTPFNTSVTNLAPPGGILQPDGNSLAQKANNGVENNKVNPFSSNYEKQSSTPSHGSVRFADKQGEDSWSGRPQNSFDRGSGRGRGDFRGRSWQSNYAGQERRFGDRSWNADSGGRRRFQESPDRCQDRGSSFKRGRWQDGRGRDGENRESWQQRNRQSFSPPWSKAGTSWDKSKSSEEEKVIAKTKESSAQDDDWEMEYAGEPEASKSCAQKSSSSLSPSKTFGSPQTIKPADKLVNHNEDMGGKGIATKLVQEKEEGELDSCSDNANSETMAIKPRIKEGDSAQVEISEEEKMENVHTFIISADGNESKGILVEVDAVDQ
ncbi:uncharacterized protein LOC143770447 isoform X2 [Ranitomeya variabilis]|uniref:uncharacterized protein LOC143770447 isoform X2 n=1 Tax=Ranitomeya variabilis TaxID=490064 RepID=UPI0040575764